MPAADEEEKPDVAKELSAKDPEVAALMEKVRDKRNEAFWKDMKNTPPPFSDCRVLNWRQKAFNEADCGAMLRLFEAMAPVGSMRNASAATYPSQHVAYTPPKADSALNLNDWSLS